MPGAVMMSQPVERLAPEFEGDEVELVATAVGVFTEARNIPGRRRDQPKWPSGSTIRAKR